MKKILIKDGKGAQFQISDTKPDHSPVSSTTSITLPKDIKLIQPLTWQEAWKVLFPAIAFPLQQDKIMQAINDAFAAKKLYLSPVSSLNKGATKGGQSEPVAHHKEDVKSHLVKPEATQSAGEAGAISQAKAGSVAAAAKAGAPSVANTCTNGCPISMVSGEELLSLTDFTLPGPLPFTWKRTYRSGHSRDLGLGHGWTHTACEHLLEDHEKVELSDDEGRTLSFKRPRINQRSKLINEQMALDSISYETYVLRQHDQPHKIFRRLGQTGVFRLTQILHPAYKSPTLSDGSDAQGFALSLHYNAQNALSRIAGNWGKSLVLTRDNRGHLTRIALQDEASAQRLTVAEYEYSEASDLIAQRDRAGRGETYAYNNHLFAQRTLATGFSYYYEWDAEEAGARCIHTWGDKGIYDYRFAWDAENNRTLSTDSRGFTKEYIYNEFGLITQETDNEGGIHKYTYENGLRTSYTDPEGNTTRYSYDSANRLIGVIDALDQRQVHYYFQDKLASSTDKDGAHWQRTYNSRGLLETLTAPDGEVTYYRYNTQGLLSKQENSRKQVTRYQWSDAGELIALINPEGHKQVFTYNSWSQLVQMDVWLASRAHGGTTHYFYNASSELERISYPTGERVDIAYNGNGQIERMSDRRGRVTHYQYDGLSQVVRRTDPEGNSLAYEYDTERNLIRLTNENGDDYAFVYDGNERLIKEVGFDGRTQHYKYNAAGHLLKHLDAGEVITEFERDPLGRMLSKVSRAMADSEGQYRELNRYMYDPAGRLKETYNGQQYLAFQYDRMGRLIKEHHSDINAQRQRISESMVDIHYQRTASGQLKKLQLPDRQTIDYQYDAADRLQNILLNSNAITHIERDAFGLEVKRQQGELLTHSDYDPMGRLVKQQTENRQQKISIINREYQYDLFGNLSSFKDGIAKGDTWEVRYVYDMVDRLKRTEGDLAENFVFDPAGNLLAQQKNSAGKTTRGNRLALQGDRKFEYDARGNLIRETRGKGGKLETVFEYNFNNQMSKVIKNGQATEYAYDPIGRRIRKQDSFGATQYLWAGDQLAQEQRNNIKKTYVYEPESFKPVAMVQDGEIYHYHLDHLGTPRELTNQQGNIVWRARYKTYGNVALKNVEEVENNLRFQGQYFDEETGLHYNRHRYYDPSVGQFTTQDPIGLLGGVNGYQYAPNPTGWIDPLGLVCKESRIAGVEAGAADKKILDSIEALKTQLVAKQEALNLWDDKTQLLFLTWFGSDKLEAKELISDRINKALDIANNLTLDNFFRADPAEDDPRLYAYVYPNDEEKIYLGQKFGNAPVDGYDSTSGTLAHEISHYKTVGDTEDHVYGQAGATELAKTNSDNALNNADNFQYFVESGGDGE
ncbi:MAG: M35 family metallo-endopeptidase [Pseudomonadota bacterium]